MLLGTLSLRVREEPLSCLRRKGISLYHRIGQQPVRERGTGEVKEGGEQVIRISSLRHLKPGFLSDHDGYLIRGWYTFTKVKEVPIREQIIMVWQIKSKFAKKVGSTR